jgi:hypothetical protein
VVKFFSREGEHLGNKEDLKQLIHKVTSIPIQALLGSPLSDFRVQERLSWVRERQTTRKEDMAYSLFGIFGIFMPLMYGEGQENAFWRLRKTIEENARESLQRQTTISTNTMSRPSMVPGMFESDVHH